MVVVVVVVVVVVDLRLSTQSTLGEGGPSACVVRLTATHEMCLTLSTLSLSVESVVTVWSCGTVEDDVWVWESVTINSDFDRFDRYT